jgi:hypothetical protein
MSISVDGFIAGSNESWDDNPLGDGGGYLHGWIPGIDPRNAGAIVARLHDSGWIVADPTDAQVLAATDADRSGGGRSEATSLESVTASLPR